MKQRWAETTPALDRQPQGALRAHPGPRIQARRSAQRRAHAAPAPYLFCTFLYANASLRDCSTTGMSACQVHARQQHTTTCLRSAHTAGSRPGCAAGRGAHQASTKKSTKNVAS